MKKYKIRIKHFIFLLGICSICCGLTPDTAFAKSLTETEKTEETQETKEEIISNTKEQEESILENLIQEENRADTTAFDGLIWQENNYVLYSNGQRIMTSGWRGIDGEKYFVDQQGIVSERMIQLNGTWFYYKGVKGSNTWEKQKKCWVSVFGRDYYFDKSGSCTKIYDNKSQWLYVIEDGDMRSAKEGLYPLKNKKIYYFNDQGIRTKTKGYEKISPELYIKTSFRGHVVNKMEQWKNRWRFYKYDKKKEMLVKQKNTWKTVEKQKYYFNARGICTKIYDMEEQTFWEYQKGKLTLVKKEMRQVQKAQYYFDEQGIRVKEPGLYETSEGQLILITEGGVLEELVPGQVMEKVFQDGKMNFCRIKDENYMYYYDGAGNLTRKLDLHGKMVALTYDDGPSQYTNEILDTLEAYGGRATFFVVGSRVNSYASTVKRTFDLGCELANHSYSHPNFTNLSQSAVKEQIQSTNQAVHHITGKSMEYLRPPGGSHNSTVRSIVGMPLILWSIDTRDWATKNAASTSSAVLNHVKDGDIVLMHDLYQQTANASKSVIPELVRRGYQLVTIGELADCRGGMEKGKLYYSLP